ncbi:MAG: transcription-repair coupling factor, partial [Treponema sp.]|nr:transcription-repair coupling factor [Treponema sp.]
MNTLSFPAFMKGILSSHAVSECIAAVRGGNYPLEIRGAEGSFRAMLLDYLVRDGLDGEACAAVVPTEQDANELALDLRTLGREARVFPWWGTVAYKEMAPVSEVFGERTRILCDLAGRNGGREKTGGPVYLIPERAFLGPVPPPEYMRDLPIPLTTGDTVDTGALAERLASYGYTRVPKVQVHGDFALRGEVLDILMGGDDRAYRVLLDFDRIEGIRRFDPLDQSSGGERPARLVIRPMRELVWTDDRIEALGDSLAALGEFPDGGRAILETLMEKRGRPGEEMFYPLAFREGPAS